VRLAEDVTSRTHGAAAARTAAEVSAFLFGERSPGDLSLTALELLRREVPSAEVTEEAIAGPATDGAGGRQYDVIKLLTAGGLATSNGAARRLIEQGGVALNGRRLAGAERYVEGEGALLAGAHVLVSKGKRDHALIRVRRG
jgi:tyrosyl-tRNA synthetase